MSQLSTNLSRFQNVSTRSVILAADDLSSSVRSLIAAIVGTTIYVCKVQLAVTTDNAATQQLEDSAGTPIVVCKSKVSPGIGPLTWDFGEDGFALTADKGLNLKNSAAGLAGTLTVTAYRRLTPNTAQVP